MKRKHMPGCYCCQDGGPCPECCDDESIPTSLEPVSYPGMWDLAWRNYDETCCCLKERWDYTGTAPISSCCELIGTDSWTTVDERKDHAFNQPSGLLGGGLPPYGGCDATCPTTQNACCISSEFKVAEWRETITGTFDNYFAVDFFLDYVEVSWTRELVRCPANGNANPEGEPACRYVMKIAAFGNWKSRINTHVNVESVAENLFVHECYELSPACTPGIPNCTQLFEGCSDEDYWCEASEDIATDLDVVCEENPIGTNCDDTAPRIGPEICGRNQGAFCWERIKYFDTPPNGNIIFDRAGDSIEENPFDPTVDCDEPECAVQCINGYGTEEVAVIAPLLDPPQWCTHPPTVETTTTTHVIDYSWCQVPEIQRVDRKFTVTGRTCCDPDALQQTSLCDPVFCETPYETTTSCDSLIRNTTPGSSNCHFSDRFGPFVICGQFGFDWSAAVFDTNTRVCSEYPPLGGRPQFGMQVTLKSCFGGSFPGAVGPCPPVGVPAACCQALECPDGTQGCDGLCVCMNVNSAQGFVKELTTAVSVTCGTYLQPECIFQIPSLTIAVET